MKIIFDFDDVLFDTSLFKKKVFEGLVFLGIQSNEIESVYKDYQNSFDIEKIYKEIVAQKKLSFDEKVKESIASIMKNTPEYLNQELLDLIDNLPKEDCFIVTTGDKHFQEQKIKSSGLSTHFLENHIIIVPGSKKEALTSLCAMYKNEVIIFIDDKEENIEVAKSLISEKLIPILYSKNTCLDIRNTILAHI